MLCVQAGLGNTPVCTPTLGITTRVSTGEVWRVLQKRLLLHREDSAFPRLS